ncbi:MAG TPA: hypothetical protein VN626_03605 [Clostridia bacterium]|nr:hypothetical protein [Clostridia bacterium]
MEKYKEFKRHFVGLLGELQAVIAETEGNQRTFLRMAAATLEGAYKALLVFDGDVTPAVELLPQEKPAAPPAKPPKPKAAEKQKYGHFSLVRMTEAEHKKLVDEYGEKVAADYIGKLELYIGSKGDKYKSHYITIRAVVGHCLRLLASERPFKN